MVTPDATQMQASAPPRGAAHISAPKPQIPDHEVLRCIGRGSYGEVWLARGVTGALRAVKVVRRDDFQMDRTFEREFQGILSFEPISRDHVGLVDILHVGRNVELGFYYYVMELADDRETGPKINVVDYEPHTLSSDKSKRVKMSLDRVIEIGISLANALAHLHDRGLSHRDIKPSNIIFVQGQAKLADIGLVAAAGQRTFVGTEGFVPPEGPGTGAADIYSLGMVLYEIVTGKDRLCFPELPEEPGDPREKKRRRMLNSVICKACDPEPKRRFASAKYFSDALRRVRVGKYSRPILPRAAALFLLCGLISFGLVWARTGTPPWPPGVVAAKLSPPIKKAAVSSKPATAMGSIRIETDPPGAEVWSAARKLGVTPLDLTRLNLGRTVFTLKMENYREEQVPVVLESGGNIPLRLTMQIAPPQKGKIWQNAYGMKFIPTKGDWHESASPVTYDEFFRVTKLDPFNVTGSEQLVVVSLDDAESFCASLLKSDVDGGHLESEQHFYRHLPVQIATEDPQAVADKEHTSFKVILQKREFGDIHFESTPPGAIVYEGDRRVGVCPCTLSGHQTGPFTFTMRLLGYEPSVITGNLVSKQMLNLPVVLAKSRMATLGVSFENSLGMKFNPIGPDFLAGIHETRVRDFATYINSTDPALAHTVAFPQTPEHPVVRVSRDQALKFCRWLTEKEQTEGFLPTHLEYRLPTDEEWSIAAELYERQGLEPASKNLQARAKYVWGMQWPPPREPGKMVGNFSDISRIKPGKEGKPADKDAVRELTLVRENYDDGFAYTSPVGSFAPNRYGLYDLAGNAAEWIMDDYGGDRYPKYGVTRGGSWATGKDESKDASGRLTHQMLLASSRNAIKPELQDSPYGFRCVIAAKK